MRAVNRGMVAFDLALGSGALLAPDRTLWVLGHQRPSPDARELFRRCAPIWLTFAAAHAVAAAFRDAGSTSSVQPRCSAGYSTDVP